MAHGKARISIEIFTLHEPSTFHIWREATLQNPMPKNHSYPNPYPANSCLISRGDRPSSHTAFWSLGLPQNPTKLSDRLTY